MIKDSGERTLFETGAVRDMHFGKGRMDLLPWYAIMEVARHCEEGALKYGERNVDRGIPLHSLLDSGSRHLAKYILGEDDEDHLRAACWNLLWALQQRTTHPEQNNLPWSEYYVEVGPRNTDTGNCLSECSAPKHSADGRTLSELYQSAKRGADPVG